MPGNGRNILITERDRSRLGIIIAIRSRFRIRFSSTGEERLCSLVFPAEADLERRRISILSALGMALIGHSAGQTIPYHSTMGVREVKIIEVFRQPGGRHGTGGGEPSGERETARQAGGLGREDPGRRGSLRLVPQSG